MDLYKIVSEVPQPNFFIVQMRKQGPRKKITIAIIIATRVMS